MSWLLSFYLLLAGAGRCRPQGLQPAVMPIERCGGLQEELDVELDKIVPLSGDPTEPGIAMDPHQLEDFCAKWGPWMDQVFEKMPSCEQYLPKHLQELAHSKKQLVHSLCYEDVFRARYNALVPCLENVKLHVQNCIWDLIEQIWSLQYYDRYTDEQINRARCCAFKQYDACRHVSVSSECGEDGASIVDHVLEHSGIIDKERTCNATSCSIGGGAPPLEMIHVTAIMYYWYKMGAWSFPTYMDYMFYKRYGFKGLLLYGLHRMP